MWVLIGVFSTAVFGMMSWQAVWFNRTLTTSFGSLRDVMDARFENVDRQLADIRTKIDGLDQDVEALTRHVFGAGPR